MIWVRGVEYGTAAELAQRLTKRGGDRVTPKMVYHWRDPDRWDNPADALTTVRINGRDYSPMPEAAAIERAKRQPTDGTRRRGRPRQLDTACAAA
ncbi:MAG TPA: hypothetical protein VIQ30_01055 [Pseudonocardia sp.]